MNESQFLKLLQASKDAAFVSNPDRYRENDNRSLIYIETDKGEYVIGGEKPNLEMDVWTFTNLDSAKFEIEERIYKRLYPFLSDCLHIETSGIYVCFSLQIAKVYIQTVASEENGCYVEPKIQSRKSYTSKLSPYRPTMLCNCCGHVTDKNIVYFRGVVVDYSIYRTRLEFYTEQEKKCIEKKDISEIWSCPACNSDDVTKYTYTSNRVICTTKDGNKVFPTSKTR